MYVALFSFCVLARGWCMLGCLEKELPGPLFREVHDGARVDRWPKRVLRSQWSPYGHCRASVRDMLRILPPRAASEDYSLEQQSDPKPGAQDGRAEQAHASCLVVQTLRGLSPRSYREDLLCVFGAIGAGRELHQTSV